MKAMRSRRSRASSFVRSIAANMDATSFPPCRPVSTVPVTIFIPKPATFRRRYCAVFTRPKLQAPARSSCGVAARPGGSSFTWTISPTPVFICLRHYSGESHINVGAGYDVTIAEFAKHIKRCVGFEGRIVYDKSRPDGTPRKLLDSSRMQAMGWKAQTELEEGLKLYYDWFLSNQGKLRETVIESTTSD